MEIIYQETGPTVYKVHLWKRSSEPNSQAIGGILESQYYCHHSNSIATIVMDHRPHKHGGPKKSHWIMRWLGRLNLGKMNKIKSEIWNEQNSAGPGERLRDWHVKAGMYIALIGGIFSNWGSTLKICPTQVILISDVSRGIVLASHHKAPFARGGGGCLTTFITFKVICLSYKTLISSRVRPNKVSILWHKLFQFFHNHFATK